MGTRRWVTSASLVAVVAFGCSSLRRRLARGEERGILSGNGRCADADTEDGSGSDQTTKQQEFLWNYHYNPTIMFPPRRASIFVEGPTARGGAPGSVVDAVGHYATTIGSRRQGRGDKPSDRTTHVVRSPIGRIIPLCNH
jgi:hypothetical protein